MASFTRKDYQRVYRFAKDVFVNTEHRRLRALLVPEACRVMDMCEEVIGQQSDRPRKSIGYQKVGK